MDPDHGFEPDEETWWAEQRRQDALLGRVVRHHLQAGGTVILAVPTTPSSKSPIDEHLQLTVE